MKRVRVICFTILMIMLILSGIIAYKIGYDYGNHFWDGFYEQQKENTNGY